VVVEDPVGRLIASSPSAGDTEDYTSLLSTLEEQDLRASKAASIDETRRERRDRYARLPDGYLSVPVERWRVGDREFFWTPIGSGAPAGYLWIDLDGGHLTPEDVVLLYWARRVLESELGKARIRLETELGVRGDFVDDLVNGHYGSVELLLQRARYLGADLSEGALVVVVDIDDFARYLERRKPKEPAIQELKRRLADAVRLQTRQHFSNFLLGPRSDNVILFLGSSESERPEDLPEQAQLLAKGVQRYVKGLLPDLTISVGIGRHKKDPALLPDAYSEAGVALEIGHRIHGPSSVSTFEGAGTYKLLFRVLQENPEELEAFYAETLEPVVAYDSRYGTELVQTLITYLGNDASTVRTAGDLFAHRHTIRYRLDRVSELTGLDVDKSEDRERLTLGIKAMQLLGRVPERPSSFSDR
jgi:sugar diacid utilization regulator